jgi:peptide/nickel transport system substrate-binding protein
MDNFLKRRWSLLPVLVPGVFLLFLVAGCTGGDSGGEGPAEISIPVENDIQTLDPVGLSDPYTSRIVWQIYEGLAGLNKEGEPVPVLAESWSSSDQHQTWTFELRPGVYFHESGAFDSPDSTRTVTAQDVKYSYTRFADGFGSFVFSGLVEGFDAYVNDQADSISGFEVVDSLTFRISLTRSDPSFISRITSPYLSIMPREVVQENPEAFGQSISVGTGPFELESRSETTVRLRRNSNYWRDTEGSLKRVTFRVVKNSQFRVRQFRNGRHDLMELPTSFIPSFMQGDGLKESLQSEYDLYSTTTYNAHYMGIAYQQVTDENLRRAIAHAINRQTIVNDLLYGQATVASSPVVPGMRGYDPPQGPSYNTDSARAALQNSNYNGRSLNLLVSGASNGEEIGQIIQGDLGEIGINVDIEQVNQNTLISRVFGGNRPDMFVLFSEWVFSAPEHIIDVYNSDKIPNPNMFGYRNDQVDKFIARTSAVAERERINVLSRRAESIALRESPAVWLYHQKSLFPMDARLDGFWIDAHNDWKLEDVRLSDEPS